MDDINNMIIYFNIFKEISANDIGLIRGFANWTKKMSYYIDGYDLVIKIPPVLIKRGTPEILSHSKRKKEIDYYMNKGNYTYVEYLIRKATDLYAQRLNKIVYDMQKKGS